jgi:hypothetical protein
MSKYKAILFSFDGDYVTDYEADTVEEVWKRVNDGGSRWYFYPFSFVIKNHGCISWRQKAIDAPDFPYLSSLKGESLKSVKEMLVYNADELCDLLNA